MNIPGDFFRNVKTIAVIGLSDKKDRPSFEVAQYLASQGFRIIPINPNVREVLGEISYPDLLLVPKEIKIDVVDIFRRSELVFPHVKEAVERGDVHTIWMQEGVMNEVAEEYAKKHGLTVYMNFCLMKTHKNIIHYATK